jgi:hypothetical protein
MGAAQKIEKAKKKKAIDEASRPSTPGSIAALCSRGASSCITPAALRVPFPTYL